jgi:hypothetical protein
MSVHQMNQQLTGDGIISEEPCSRFTLFPFLPTEIRLRIWRFHNYRPRIIMCKCYFWSNKHGDDQTCFRLPASFLVNSESREEAKKAFSLVFESLLTYDIAFNNVADTLYFEHQWIEYTFPSKDFSKAGFHAGTLVKSLALHLDLCNYRDLAGVLQVEEFAFVLDIHGVCKALKGFPNVQELFLITESKSQSGMFKNAYFALVE